MSLSLHKRLASLAIARQHCAFPVPSSLVASSSKASTSYLPSYTSPITSSFHTSSRTCEKKRKQVARLKKKVNLERRVQAVEQLKATAPDPIRGYGPNNEQIWLSSELKRILLDRESVWDGPDTAKGVEPLPQLKSARKELLGPTGEEALLLPPGASHYALSATQSDTSRAATDLVSASPSTTSSSPLSESALPQTYLNFALTPEDADLLFTKLPASHATLSAGGQEAERELTKERIERFKIDEDQKVDSLRRILDLRNANSRGIRFENTRRILRRFGQGQGSGRSEVQAAVLTMRIHSLADHHQSMPRDVHCKRGLRALVMQRAKVLRYLKTLDLARYVQCLKDIGVEQRAVEGEIIMKG